MPIRTFWCCVMMWSATGLLRASDLPVLFSDDFESGDLSRWSATDPTAWKLETENGSQVLHQFRQSHVATPVRCPFNRAVVRGVSVRDLQFDVDLQSTTRDYPHRSLCLMFGYQDPSHFYYVHLGQKADEHANQIFIVNGAPRVKISKTSTDGTPWDDKWHRVRISRQVESGETRVYFDNLDQPAMTATDTTFAWGEVGIGSFDDTGRFDNLELRGVPAVR
jgi:hypothetical protein